MPHLLRKKFTIVGAGAGGLCAGIKLKERGQDDFLIFDRESRVGGTWQRNSYPGLECDIASPLYCYSFAPNPDWSGPFPPHAEIREYLERVARERGLEPHLRLGTGVRSARWDEDLARWRLVLDDGGQIESQFLISAVGMFGPPAIPEIPGLDDFQGTIFHSAKWDHDHDLRGERVAVVGSAASAVQFVPEIAPTVARLHVFQRTPNWVLPKPNAPYTPAQKAAFRDRPELLAESRRKLFEIVEKSLTYLEPGFFQAAEAMGRQALEVVEDPDLRKKLTPDHPFGAKRPLASNEYLQCFNRKNVELVVEPVARVTARGVVTADGREREVDTIILATGFETQKYVSVIDVEGRDGLSIAESWKKNGPEAHLGVTTSGFPNLFMLYGPNTNGGNSIILMLEFQVDYTLRLIEEAERAGVDWLDVRRDVMDAYNAGLQQELERVAVWQSGANDYYRAASGRIVTQWPHGFAAYETRVDAVDLASFETGKALRRATAPSRRVPSRAAQTALGWSLLLAPALVLFGVHARFDSAILAAVAALSLSTTIQIIGERFWPARPLAAHAGARLAVEAFQGLVYGMVLSVVTIFAGAALVSAVKSVLGVPFALALPVWGQALALVVVADFLDYFRHRHEHESDGLFWRVHSVHHSIREFSLLAGLAVHPLEPVFTFVSYGVVAGLLGLSPDATILGFTIAMIAMGAQHANTFSRLGWLSNVVAHIDGHRWHHDMALSTGRNVNYANVFSLWDRLWGTFQSAERFDGEFGIEPFRDAYPKDLVGQAKMAVAAEYARRVRAL